jgi:hypothetical protein
MAAGVTITELRATGASGGTSTSAGRWSFVPGQSQFSAHTAPPNETMATSAPMTILPQGKCMPATSSELAESNWASIVVSARRQVRPRIAGQ